MNFILYTNAFKTIFKRETLKSSISSLVRIWKIRHSSPGCGFVRILRVVYFPVKHSRRYNKKLNTRIQIPYLQATRYHFVYYIKIKITTFLTIFGRFPTSFRNFTSILQMIPKPHARFRGHFPKISEDYRSSRRLSRNINKFQYSERVKHALISNITSLISLQLNYRKLPRVQLRLF